MSTAPVVTTKLRAPPSVSVHTSTEVVIVTPEMAQAWLERNKENRPIREHHVARLAKDMKEGRWCLNGEAIVFDYNGALLDGQHRLWASFDHGQSFQTVVVRGVAPEAFSTIDSGLKRSAGDVLAKAGHSYGVLTAATLRLIHFYETGCKDYMIVQRMSNAETLEMLKQYPEAENAAKTVNNTPGLAKVCSPTALAALAYYALEDDAEQAAAFLGAMATGESLRRSDPRLTARNFFINAKATRRKIHHRDQFALLVKAWNAFREGREMSVLKYVDSEAFPLLHHRGKRRRAR